MARACLLLAGLESEKRLGLPRQVASAVFELFEQF